VERAARITQADARNVVIFPARFRDRCARLDRPHSEIAPWSIWISYSPDLVHWGESEVLVKPGSCSLRIPGKLRATFIAVVFTCGAVAEGDGSIKVYWGGGDTVICAGTVTWFASARKNRARHSSFLVWRVPALVWFAGSLETRDAAAASVTLRKVMREGIFEALKRFVLWDYSRGSLPYDIMVVLILAFIFLTPRQVFRDQPKPKDVVMIPSEAGGSVFWIDAELLTLYPDQERTVRAEGLIRSQSRGKRLKLVQLEPVFDAEEEIKGFMAFTEP
jgi:hypothetical protein